MKCCRCPLYHYWSNESDRGEACAIFGDGWDSPFQYEDKEGTIVGCYLDRHYIEKADAERDEYYASMAESAVRYFEDEPQTEEHCETCRHKDECEGATYEYKNTEWWCLGYAPIEGEPQTETSTNSEKLQLTDEPQTEQGKCPFDDPIPCEWVNCPNSKTDCPWK